MKKVISLLICFVFIFSFAGCDKSGSNSNNAGDIQKYVEQGVIPEAQFKLGENPDTVKQTLEKEEENSEQDYLLSIIEGEKTVLIQRGNFNYYYTKETVDKGLDYIVSFDKAFGFDIGEVIVTVKEALADFDVAEEPISMDNAFFMPIIPEGVVLKCKFGENTVAFVFENNALCATAIYCRK